MKHFRPLLCAGAGVVFLVVGLFGQIMNHPLTLSGGDSVSYISRPDVPDTLRTLAIMIQFQPDDDSRTTGDGQFELSSDDTDMLNPPPHNAAYFEYHLEFARRYYDEVSGGKLTIEYEVWDEVFTLPEQMGTYSPRDDDFTEIGNLFEESWELAALEAPDIPFHEFDTFIIFHAGVGRDVDLTSIFGFDPTPLDIPSLYLGPQGLKRIFGDDYEGVEVGPDGFRINNSMILPETQNRELDLVTGRELLQLGMNGLVCAMYGSRLGLPDLFNTDTGRSGIGRFGLMDGQAIFSFMGLFPPELSAWEKYHLGWIEPETVLPGEHHFDLSAVALRVPASILRVPINEREYYLVENRHRNPFGTGQTLTLIQNGEEVTFTVERDRVGFNAFDIGDITGVVLDAEVYDWSLPGAYIEADNIFYDGGIVIWHIDERIIDARIGENRINADIENRGVRVVEADGSQDIGREFEFLQPGQGSEDGTQFDFWYEGNPAPIYENRFDANTIPPSVSNTGAPSNIAMYDFSERAPVMQVSVRVGSDKMSLIEGFPYRLNAFSDSTSPVPFRDGILFVNDGELQVVDKNGILTHIQEEHNEPVTSTPAWYGENNNIVLFTRTGDSNVTKWNIAAPENNEPYEFVAAETFSIGSVITAGPTLLSDGVCLVGTGDGEIKSLVGSVVTTVGSLSDGSEVIDLHIFSGNEWAATSATKVLFVTDEMFERQFNENVFRSTAYLENGIPSVVGIGDGVIFINQEKFSIDRQISDSFGFPIAVDLDKDGMIDIISPMGGRLYAFNKSGAVLDYFPHQVGDSHLIDVYPVAGDFDGNEMIDVAVHNNNDLLRFHNARGSAAAGTPLAVGERIVGSPAVFESEGNMALAFITADDLLYAYRFSGQWDENRIWWGEERLDNRRTNVQTITLHRQPITDEFLPEDRAYNWPNPVYDGTTNIRYYLNENADVSISIYEMNGERITSFDGPGIGGMDNEVTWDASGIQSGVYLGRIEARNADNSKVVFIKIAVVR